MTLKKLSISALAGAISMWLLAGLWHKVVMAQFYLSETEASHEGASIIFIAYIILAGLMTYLYSKIFNGGNPQLRD